MAPGRLPTTSPHQKELDMLFEKSKKDKEPKGMKEGSKKEEKLDRKQAKKPKKK